MMRLWADNKGERIQLIRMHPSGVGRASIWRGIIEKGERCVKLYPLFDIFSVEDIIQGVF